ncbi:MAG: class C sortase [Anaerotignum sp.]
MKKDHSTIILIGIFLVGLSLLLYPSVSNYWNSFHSTQAIAGYAQQVADMDEEKYQEIWKEAQEYNQSLLKHGGYFTLSEEENTVYQNLLNVGGTGIMGYIEIEAIDVSLPIYHGTDENTLQIAVGHLDWTSLPVGGENTHCVLSGHRGLPSAKLFTNLDELVVGDTFVLRVLDEILTYEVDQILIVEPKEIESLQIEEDKDLCTLVTCTPYGINSHRLLVRGHRVDNAIAAKLAHITSDAVQIEPILVASVIAVPILLVLLVILLTVDSKKKRRKKYHDNENDI